MKKKGILHLNSFSIETNFIAFYKMLSKKDQKRKKKTAFRLFLCFQIHWGTFYQDSSFLKKQERSSSH